MTNTPLTATQVRRSWHLPLFLTEAVLAAAVAIISILWSLHTVQKQQTSELVYEWSFAVPVVLIILLLGLLLAVLWMEIRSSEEKVRLRVEKEKRALMELATHQLGVPLATFRWWLDLLKHPEGTKMDHKEVYKEVKQALERMDSILHSLTLAESVDLQSLSSSLVTLSSLRHLILDVVQGLSNDALIKKVTIEIKVPEDIPPVSMDSMQIKSVLEELVGNAIGFSKPDTIISIVVTADAAKRMVNVEVHDHGIGIPAAELPHVFDKFFRASNAQPAKPAGNGLGLFNAKGIVEKHGGTIGVRSKAKKGTSVFFTLPFEEGPGK